MTFAILRTLHSRVTENNFWKEHCIYLPAMLGWFTFSTLLSTYNKFVFGRDHFHFPFPLLMTAVHFGGQWLFSYSLSNVPPASPSPSQSQHPSIRQSLGGDQIKLMSWGIFLSISVPCGLVTASDVGLSNLALVRVTITFYTMIKASAPIFVVLSAYIFGLERITTALLMVVVTICAGEALTVLGEVQFELYGFLLCLFASIMSGLRWTLVQLKLQSIDPPLKSTIATMRILSPVMFASMFLFSMAIERPWELLLGEDMDGVNVNFDTRYTLLSIGLAVLGGTLAIFMIMCEFYLIMHASAIVLMIGGILKELITILAGVFLFGDPINSINLLGCAIVFLGVLLFKLSLHIKKLEKHCDSIENGDDSDEIQSDEGSETNLFGDYDEVEDNELPQAINVGGVETSSRSLLESNQVAMTKGEII